MRRSILAAVLAAGFTALTLVPAASSISAKQRCDAHRPPQGSFADCFSGGFRGTGFHVSMNDSIRFRLVSMESLRSQALWKDWVADTKKFKSPAPCKNDNAIPYVGSFSFYGGGSFIGCSQAKPYKISGYFAVNAPFHFADDETTITLTHGVFWGFSAWNNVLELVFSDAVHNHFSQPEVVLGPAMPRR